MGGFAAQTYRESLTFRELEGLSSARLTVLLAFNLSRIPGQEAFWLQLRTKLRFQCKQCTSNSKAYRTGLPCVATASDICEHISATCVLMAILSNVELPYLHGIVVLSAYGLFAS